MQAVAPLTGFDPTGAPVYGGLADLTFSNEMYQCSACSRHFDNPVRVAGKRGQDKAAWTAWLLSKREDIEMIHRLTEWEDNGPNDSDFWASVYDDGKNEVRAVLKGSTRFAGYRDGGPDLGQPISDPTILQKALRVLTDHIYTIIRAAEYRGVLEPSKAETGTILRLLRSVKHNGAKIAEGTVGEVFWIGAYGQFYRNGYNRPGRDNTRVGLNFADGSSAYVALSACRLNRDPDDDEEMGICAWELAQHCGFSRMTGEKHAWDSENYALALYQRTYCQHDNELIAAW
jgi:hypothetical protein